MVPHRISCGAAGIWIIGFAFCGLPGNAQHPQVQILHLSDPLYFVEHQAPPVDDSTSHAGVEAELAQLRKRIEELESLAHADAQAKQNEQSKKEAAVKDAAGESKEKKKDDGWIDISSEKWTVRLGGHVQSDYINWAKADPAITGAQDYFEFRRLRLLADGTGYGLLDFRLQLTLEPETIGENAPGIVMSPDVKDAYLSMNEIPWLGRFRIGNFFVPFGIEQVTNDTNNIFMERSIPSQGIFTADREVGFAFYNATESQRLTWTYGAFFDNISDAIKERIDDNQGYRLSGRITGLPFYDDDSKGRYLMHVGAGLLYTDDQDNRVRFRARPQIHEGPRLIDSGVLDADGYTTGCLEFATVWANFTVQSEGFLSNVDMRNGSSVRMQGAYIHFSYFLTGENRVFERFGQHGAQFARNAPTSNFFVVPNRVSPGAWELKTRWSYLDLDSVNEGQYNDFTFGCNWYWNDRTRVMFDWIHPYTSADAVFGAVEADILAMRFDFNW